MKIIPLYTKTVTNQRTIIPKPDIWSLQITAGPLKGPLSREKWVKPAQLPNTRSLCTKWNLQISSLNFREEERGMFPSLSIEHGCRSLFHASPTQQASLNDPGLRNSRTLLSKRAANLFNHWSRVPKTDAGLPSSVGSWSSLSMRLPAWNSEAAADLYYRSVVLR